MVKPRVHKHRRHAIPPARDLLSFIPAKQQKDFAGVKRFCMFLCHARSGHSLLGSLLDAHPEAVIAHEFDALRALQTGLCRSQLFYGLWQRSLRFTGAGRKWNGYEYRVPHQWHGRYRKLTVIGDKMGSVSVHALLQDPQLLQRLHQTIRVPIKFFCVIRNPFDNIKTISTHHHNGKLDPAIEGYFSLCDAIETIRQQIAPEDWMNLHHEILIAEPKQTLDAACRFLTLPTTPDYLTDCASIIFDAPQRRRAEVEWTAAQREKVESGIRRFAHLSQYAFDS